MTIEIINETVDPGATVSGEVRRDEAEKSTDFAFFIRGDAESADVTVEFFLYPVEDDVVDGNKYRAEIEDHKNVDITNGLVYHPETRGVKVVHMEVTNNGQNSTDLLGKAEEYQRL
jgi:hypothetical protein